MLRGIIKGFLDIIYPEKCVSCKKKLEATPAQGHLCMECIKKIRKNTPPFCHFCGRNLLRGKEEHLNKERKKNLFLKNVCPECIKEPRHFDRAFSPFVYDGVIKELIHEFKYKNKDYLGKTFGRFLTDFINDYRIPIKDMDYIVPVPLNKTRLREREFNQAEILSEAIAKEFGKEMLKDAVIRHRNTATQTDLDTNKRFLNVKNSFLITDKFSVKGKNILLVDDVLTTGATSSEIARILKEAGAKIIFALTLAN